MDINTVRNVIRDDCNTLLDLVGCNPNAIIYVFEHRSICGFTVDGEPLDILESRLNGNDYPVLCETFGKSVEEVKASMMDAAVDVVVSINFCILAALGWNRGAPGRSVERLASELGMGSEELEASLGEVQDSEEFSESGKKLLGCWVTGKTAEEAVSEAGISLRELDKEFSSAWQNFYFKLLKKCCKGA